MQVKNEGRKNMERKVISALGDAEEYLEADSKAGELETAKLDFYKAIELQKHKLNVS